MCNSFIELLISFIQAIFQYFYLFSQLRVAFLGAVDAFLLAFLVYDLLLEGFDVFVHVVLLSLFFLNSLFNLPYFFIYISYSFLCLLHSFRLSLLVILSVKFFLELLILFLQLINHIFLFFQLRLRLLIVSFPIVLYVFEFSLQILILFLGFCTTSVLVTFHF